MTIKICVDCNQKIFYNKMHKCLEKKIYQPCSLEEQDLCDEIDELTNSTFKNQFMCRESRYSLNYDGPVMGVIVGKIKEEPKQYKSYIKTPCQYCGFLTSEYYKEKHESTKKCQKIKLKYYRG